jgi:hypothetical protein
MWTGGYKLGILTINNFYSSITNKKLAAIYWWLEERIVVLEHWPKN